MTEVEDLCGTLTILHHGRVAFSGTVEELRKQAPAAAHRLRTSDDEKAFALAAESAGVQVAVAADGTGLDVRAAEAALDGYVLALGHAGIATRGLAPTDSSLETLFLRLTADTASIGPEAPSPATGAPPEAPARVERGRVSPRGVLAAAGVEHAKLRAQFKPWATLAACLLGPFAFALAMRVQGSLPEDTLFGRLAKTSGFAIPLVVLGFAALWAFPVLTSIVAGDLFAAEDRHGTWPNLLTRSRTRGEIFAAKVVAGLTFSVVAVGVLAASSIAAGVVVIGRQPLVGLSGTLLSPGSSLGLAASAWMSIVPPVLGFTMLALLLSAATRSSAAGIGLPVLIGFGMQLSSYVDGASAIQHLLLTPPFLAWHGLFTEHRYYGPLLQGTATSGAYFAGCLAAAYLVLRRREVGTS
jgi:ABC-2 type transport system permease protein